LLGPIALDTGAGVTIIIGKKNFLCNKSQIALSTRGVLNFVRRFEELRD
jgi:hypothetical protein